MQEEVLEQEETRENTREDAMNKAHTEFDYKSIQEELLKEQKQKSLKEKISRDILGQIKIIKDAETILEKEKTKLYKLYERRNSL